MTEKRKPREFWIAPDEPKFERVWFRAPSEVIHVREVLDDDLLPERLAELYRSRSEALDEAKKWRALAEELTADLQKHCAQTSEVSGYCGSSHLCSSLAKFRAAKEGEK